ncbi:MAG: hypothetical protein LBT31_05600 [Synergistaceae bacterium]|jgi:hypothetical protein|nr:hypothetical protein [Synergistaceae bacterium]
MKSSNVEITGDMLNIHSTVQEIMRALYFYSADYIMVLIGKNERLLHMDQLVALLDQGKETATMENLPSVVLKGPLVSRMSMEDIPPSSPLLVFSNGELSGTTFEAFREKRIRENTVFLPGWWSVPLPLLHMKDDRLSLNDAALKLIPGGAKSLTRQMNKIKNDKMIVIKEKKKERTFSLSPLGDNTFFIEDISGDFEMVEDLVWWAAIGSAFVRRMEGNGLIVRRVAPHAESPEGAVEVIPCSWDGELVGKLAIELTAEAPETAVDSLARESSVKPAKPKPAKPVASQPPKENKENKENKNTKAPKKAGASAEKTAKTVKAPEKKETAVAPKAPEKPKKIGTPKKPETPKTPKKPDAPDAGEKPETPEKVETRRAPGRPKTAKEAKSEPVKSSAELKTPAEAIKQIPEKVIEKYAEQVEIFQAAQLLEPVPAKRKPRGGGKGGRAPKK